MKSVSNFSLRNKLAIWLFTIIIVVSGLYSGMNMKLETLPNLNIPVVSMTTVYPGATPEQVSENVTSPLEERIKNLPGVEAVSSTSLSNISSIVVEYNYDQDMDKAVADLKEVVGKAKLPEGVQDSNVNKISLDSFPVYSASVSGKDKSLAELTKLAEKEIIPSLQGIEGVSSVTVSGQQVEEVALTFHEDKLASYGLTQETAQGLIKGSNVKLPLGLYPINQEDTSIVVDGNISSLEDLKAVKLPFVKDGQPGLVALSDVADVSVVTKAESISRTNGKESIGIQVVKSSDANTVDVVNAVKKKVKTITKDHDDITIVNVYDQGKPIEESVHTMLSKAVIGAGFAVVIILLFLRDIKSTIISIISIPLSLLIAVLLLKQLDITLNIMTLGAMTVAIGRVIDDSIVVIENIYRRLSLSSEKLAGRELILASTKEVFVPIFSSTLVTIAVFLPLGLVKGTVGELFLPFALTIVFSLLASLLVAITIVPMMAHSMFKSGVKQETHHDQPGKLAGGYKRVLQWSLNHKAMTLILAFVLLFGSFGLVPAIGFSFMSSDQEKMLNITYTPAPGESKQSLEDHASKAETYFLKKKDVETLQYSVGGEDPMNPAASNQAVFYVIFEKDTKNFDNEQANITKDLKHLVKTGEWSVQNVQSGGSSNGLTLYVYGEDKQQVEPIVAKIMNHMDDKKEFKNVKSSLAKTYDQYTLVVDQAKASAVGLTAGQVAMALNQSGTKPVLTTLKKDGKEINVIVEVEKKTYHSIDDLTKQKVKNPMGMAIPISTVAKAEKGVAADNVTKRDGKFYAQITADFTTKNVGKASKDLQAQIDKMDLPAGSSVDFGGVTEQMYDSFKQLGLAIAAAVAVVYLVLVITFGGGLAPFAILFSLPFAIIGGLVALLISGETISVSSLIGALMLIGIVVTNAIVLVDRVIHQEQEGKTTRDALLDAAVTRLRPILMTAIATIGALIPLAIGMEGGGLISKGLGVTVIGGLVSSTLLTLVIVPVVYEILMNIKQKRAAKKEKKKKK